MAYYWGKTLNGLVEQTGSSRRGKVILSSPKQEASQCDTSGVVWNVSSGRMVTRYGSRGWTAEKDGWGKNASQLAGLTSAFICKL